jgi:hypothetical protein
MTKGNVFDANLVTCVDQSVVRMSALSENLGDPFLLQALCNERRSVQFRFSFLLSSSAGKKNPAFPAAVYSGNKITACGFIVQNNMPA